MHESRITKCESRDTSLEPRASSYETRDIRAKGVCLDLRHAASRAQHDEGAANTDSVQLPAAPERCFARGLLDDDTLRGADSSALRVKQLTNQVELEL